MKKIFIYIYLVALLVSCRDKFELPLRNTDVSLLVVEGVLNAGGPTTTTLSKTVKVNEAFVFKPVLGAKLSVEGKAGGSLILVETSNGNYTNTQLPLIIGQEYRLRIKTNDNKEYLSDYVLAKKSPEIDAINWKKEEEALRISVNTHDASNSTRYYKWDFEETWEILSFYTAYYRWVSGTTIVPAVDYNKRCWKYAKSNSILLGSTAHLESDVINEAPIQFIVPNEERLGVRYSMLLRQQAVSKEAYEYFQLMKKNTEALGSIFDPQPSELRGNIKCVTNPDESVIGYITASTISQKRIFITATEADWRFSQTCESMEVPNNPESLKLWLPGYLPFDAKEGMNGPITYYLSQARCVDCTKRGGDLIRPSYW